MAAGAPSNSIATLDLTSLPPVYVLQSQITSQNLREAEEILTSSNAKLTYDVREAGVVLTDVSTERRARLELKWLGVDLVQDGYPMLPRQARKRLKLQTDSLDCSNEQVHERGDNYILSASRSVHSPNSSDSGSRWKPRHVSTHFSIATFFSLATGRLSQSRRPPTSC